MENVLDEIIRKLRTNTFTQVPSVIYMNFKNYNKLQDEIQEMTLDYNSSTIVALGQLSVVVDIDLTDEIIEIL
jgi:hypothetical protein